MSSTSRVIYCSATLLCLLALPAAAVPTCDSVCNPLMHCNMPCADGYGYGSVITCGEFGICDPSTQFAPVLDSEWLLLLKAAEAQEVCAQPADNGRDRPHATLELESTDPGPAEQSAGAAATGR